MSRNNYKALVLSDEKDFEKAFIEYGEFIYRFTLIRVNYDKELAEDLAQETFLKAWEYRVNFEEEKSSLKNWLFQIAKNLIIDKYRKKDFSNDFSEDYLMKAGFEEDFIKNADYKLVLLKMNELNGDHRELIFLKYIEGMTDTEISLMLKKSRIWVKVTTFRAMQKLRKLVN